MFSQFFSKYNPIEYTSLTSSKYYSPRTKYESNIPYYPLARMKSDLKEEDVIDIPEIQIPEIQMPDPLQTPVQAPVQAAASSYNPETKIDEIISVGRTHLGKKYFTGTHGPNTFDCSGFVYSIFKDSGINVPLNIYKLTKAGTHVPTSDIRKGDMIVTSGTGQSGLHVELVTEVLGNGNIKTIGAKGRDKGVDEGVRSTKGIKDVRRLLKNGGKLIPRYRYIK